MEKVEITNINLKEKEVVTEIDLEELKKKAQMRTLNLGEIQNILNYLLNK